MKLKRKPQLKALTGLRFFAAIHVVLFHYLLGNSSETLPQNLVNFASYGYSGVSLFFVLSGFILAYNYADTEVTKSPNLKKFWLARFARLYPLYLVALIISSPGIISRIIQATSRSSFIELMASFFTTPLLIQSWTPWTACTWNCPGWSLSAEAFFYLLFPFISIYIYHLSNKKILFLCSICWLICLTPPLIYLGWLSADSFSQWDRFIIYFPLFHLSQFIMGVSTGILLVKNHLNRSKKRKIFDIILSKSFDPALLILAIILVLFSGNFAIPYSLINNGLLAPLFCLSIYTLSIRKTGLSKWLALPKLTILGEASYSMYILHLPINSLFRIFSEKIGYIQLVSIQFLIIRIILLIGLSIIILFVVEKPAKSLILKYHNLS